VKNEKRNDTEKDKIKNTKRQRKKKEKGHQ
jgi:hypothetical protein